MTGLESILVLLKIGTPLIILVLSAIGKFLWDIKQSSKQTEKDFHNFQVEFKTEISSIKTKIELMDSKLRDSYTRAESDNRLLQLENKIVDKIYAVLNRNRQVKNNPTKE